MFQKQITNKRAVSEVVGYTILILIAIALSIGVYSYVKIYIPHDRLACQEDISLSINDLNCTILGGVVTLNVVLENNGFFNVTDAYVRIGASNRKVKSQINQGDTRIKYQTGSGVIFSLPPGQEILLSYSSLKSSALAALHLNSSAEYILEIEPAVWMDNKAVVCNNAVITEKLTCQAQ